VTASSGHCRGTILGGGVSLTISTEALEYAFTFCAVVPMTKLAMREWPL
jgi:hypothetical protein